MYGWVLLIGIILIAALFFLNPISQPENCKFNNNNLFSCANHILYSVDKRTNDETVMEAEIVVNSKKPIELVGLACVLGNRAPELDEQSGNFADKVFQIPKDSEGKGPILKKDDVFKTNYLQKGKFVSKCYYINNEQKKVYADFYKSDKIYGAIYIAYLNADSNQGELASISKADFVSIIQ